MTAVKKWSGKGQNHPGFWVLGIFLLGSATSPGQAGSHRFWLAAQHDWGNRQGFYFNFENTSEGAVPCKLETLRLILGVGDGQSWRFLFTDVEWEFDRDYTARAVIGPQGAEIWLDGERLGQSPGGFVPSRGPCSTNTVPGWASDPAEYLVRQTSLQLSTSSGRHREVAYPQPPLPLFLFAGDMGHDLDWKTEPAETLILTAMFRLIRYPDLREMAPFIDRYGQCRYVDWSGKVRTDADLLQARQEEEERLQAWGQPEGRDAYGGWTQAGWKERGTGFYQVKQHRGFWWLLSPAGNPCFYLGLSSAPGHSWETTPVSDREFLFEWLPSRTGPEAAAWNRNCWGLQDGTEYVAFHTVNMIRKYGPGWERQVTESAVRRIQTWGFSGIGKWGGTEGLASLPVLGRWDVPNVARHPDIFDPAVRDRFRESLRRQVEPRRNDPFVVGWSLGNEYDEIITRQEVIDILKRGAEVAAKRALVDYARQTLYGGEGARLAQAWGLPGKSAEEILTAVPQVPEADQEALRRFYAERYYEFIYRTLKEIDPNHLYLGFWIVPGWWENQEDWRLSARYCDVIGYDRYANEFADEQLLKLMAEASKPVLCGEFSFPAFYGGSRGYGRYPVWADDDADSGERYRNWVEAAAQNPFCVGVAWFHYRDQPLTGRGPGRGPRLVHGEHYAFGAVDVTDRPKWDLVERMRQANLIAARQRLEASASQGNTPP